MCIVDHNLVRWTVKTENDKARNLEEKKIPIDKHVWKNESKLKFFQTHEVVDERWQKEETGPDWDEAFVNYFKKANHLDGTTPSIAGTAVTRGSETASVQSVRESEYQSSLRKCKIVPI